MPLQNEVFWGERLQLARDFRGLTQKQLGEEVAASSAMIARCETGIKRDPAPDLVEACAEVLGFEEDFFYRELDDVFLERECSFRHRRSTPEKTKTQIRAHATLLGMVIQQLRGYFAFPEVDLPRIPATTFEDVELAAENARNHWRLGLDGPIWQMGRVLEHAGVIIVRHFVQSSKVDAFSRQGKTTVIFLNEAIQSPSRWNFDIGHECGHLIMHAGIHTGDVQTEEQADRFASAFLMPRRAFSREFLAAPFSWKHIFDLKRRWHTSASAIVRRAYDLGLIGAAQYRRAFQYMSFKGWTKGEPAEPVFQEPELLQTAFNALGNGVDLTVDQLRSKLHFTHKTFKDVTGVQIATSSPKMAEVISMRIA
ncbi:helix-turn-helix domain-containing protein [Tunturiibacter lichenicola]|uniref:helix-turn-helix domain-containing protein n=1 Tax=Tunturiibacter lichenicola TaxID=2051959 RepID=UPI003D9B2D9E